MSTAVKKAADEFELGSRCAARRVMKHLMEVNGSPSVCSVLESSSRWLEAEKQFRGIKLFQSSTIDRIASGTNLISGREKVPLSGLLKRENSAWRRESSKQHLIAKSKTKGCWTAEREKEERKLMQTHSEKKLFHSVNSEKFIPFAQTETSQIQLNPRRNGRESQIGF
jgi:hypothetical protein